MITTLDELKTAAAGLPETDRARLAQFLLHSLDEGSDVDARRVAGPGRAPDE